MNSRLFLYVSLSMLASCVRITDTPYPPAYTSGYNDMRYYSQIYSQGVNYTEYNDINDINAANMYSGREVKVPESYHVGAYHSPTRAKDRDRNWVSNQNPQGYTIEIADGEKPAQVAKKLYLAPKNDRMAEIKYQRDGRDYYKGLYGSYSSKEDAEKALNNLPAELKQGANIKDWSSIQNTAGD
ncbi:SPOR domain-containing protein [Legionella gresilensis]|uniref:SPOR domain-containing protein n=1 Tax=Legionella gresilensis TaxID=91823 RepID=UPI0010417612|nr:SPOR domain-containing protein [Legionella gresilensis]